MKPWKSNNLLFLISLICFLFNFFIYLYLKMELIPTLTEPTETMIMLGNFVIFSLGWIGIYHFYLLIQVLKINPTENKSWQRSIFVVFVTLSGITLFSDAILLSEIAKEYILWDVNGQWNILFGFTLFHFLIISIGYLLLLKNKSNFGILFESPPNQPDRMYLSLHQVGLICGFLGMIAIFLSIYLPIPARFRGTLLMMFATLAAIPWVAYMIYWLFKNRVNKFTDWLDEKQIQDSSVAAFFTLLVSMPLILISVYISGFYQSGMSAVYWLTFIFFLQLSIFSINILRRN